MTNLVPRENMFQDLFDFRRDFDQIFNRIMLGSPYVQEQFVPGTVLDFLPPVESYVDKDAKMYFCRVSLPGMEAKDIEINSKGNLLTIKGHRKFTRTIKVVDMLNEEITYGSFDRTLTLPEGVLADKLAAEYRNGILEITAPVAVTALPHKVEIKAWPLAKTVGV